MKGARLQTTEFFFGVVTGMLSKAQEKKLKPNAVVIGIETLKKIANEYFISIGVRMYPERLGELTIFGLPVIPDYNNDDTIRLTFDEFSI